MAGTFVDTDHTEPFFAVVSERVPSVRRDDDHVTGFVAYGSGTLTGHVTTADGKPLLIYSDSHKVAGGSSA